MSRRWALVERVEAPDGHMVRWRLAQTPWFGIYVHRLDAPDDARPIPHTHPWGFVSLVLRGGYTEHVERRDATGRVRWSVPQRSWRVGSVHVMRAADAHTITALRRSPTWTLVLAGRRRPEPSWGYWEGREFTPWNEHAYASQRDQIAPPVPTGPGA